MNTFTLLAIIHVWGATQGHYGFFEIALTPGFTQAECVAANHTAAERGTGSVCDTDDHVAAFVLEHGCLSLPLDSIADTTVKMRCVR